MKDYVKLRQRPRKGCTALFLDIYYKGERKQESLNLFLVPELTREDKRKNKDTLAIAEQICAEKLTQMKNSLFDLSNTSDVTLFQFFEMMMEKKKDVKNTYNNWASALIYIKKYQANDIRLCDITSNWCNGFVKFLDDFKLQLATETRKLSNNTKLSYYRKVKAAFNEAVKLGYIRRSPCVGVDSPKQQQAERCFLTIDELVKMNAVDFPDHVKRPFVFSCLTGLRYSDIKKMTWGEISVVDGMYRITFRQQKTHAIEYLDLNAQASELLGARGGDDDLVFETIATPTRMNDALREWALRAGVDKHLTFHSGRHTFATMMLTLGTDIYTVSKLLGHSQVLTTQIYAKIIDSKKRDAVNKIPNIKI